MPDSNINFDFVRFSELIDKIGAFEHLKDERLLTEFGSFFTRVKDLRDKIDSAYREAKHLDEKLHRHKLATRFVNEVYEFALKYPNFDGCVEIGCDVHHVDYYGGDRIAHASFDCKNKEFLNYIAEKKDDESKSLLKDMYELINGEIRFGGIKFNLSSREILDSVNSVANDDERIGSMILSKILPEVSIRILGDIYTGDDNEYRPERNR